MGQNRWYVPFWLVGAPPILEPSLVVGLVDVRWGYDLDFDPWPGESAIVLLCLNHVA